MNFNTLIIFLSENIDVKNIASSKGYTIGPVYHGTDNKFNEFDMSKVGLSSGDAGYFGKGFYFTPNKSLTNYYGKNIISVFLSIKNPFIVHGDKEDLYKVVKSRKSSDITNELLSLGYDGVIIKQREIPGVTQTTPFHEVLVFKSSQIKLADEHTFDDGGNEISLSERFDINNPDIRY